MNPETAVRLPEILTAYLSEKLPQVRNLRVFNLYRCSGGSSRAMWFFDADWEGEAPIAKTLAFRADESLVFRDTEYTLKGEFDIYRALEDTAVPVIANYFYEADPKWAGEPFVIRERREGVSSSFADVPVEQRRAILDHFVEILAAQHALDWEQLGLSWLGVPANGREAAVRLLDTWEGVARRESLEPQPVLTAAMAWLRRNIPEHVDRIVLNQGQVGPGQFLFAGERVAASLDWEQAFLGDPMSDVAYFSITSRPWVGDYVDTLLERYSRLTDLPVREENLRFYQVFQSYWAVSNCISAIYRVGSGELRRAEAFWLGTSAQVRFKQVMYERSMERNLSSV